MIGVNSDKDIATARKAVTNDNINWRSFWNGEKGTQGPITVKWKVEYWPSIYLIDAKGIIRYKNIRGEELDTAIEKLMAEADRKVELKH